LKGILHKQCDSYSAFIRGLRGDTLLGYIKETFVHVFIVQQICCICRVI